MPVAQWKKKINWKEWFTTALLVVVLVAIRSSLLDQYRVPSGSMLPSILLGDHLIVNKMAFDLRFPLTDWVLLKRNEPLRGSIVVFKFPKDPDIIFVKRLIGLPGDQIKIENGFVEVNGQKTVQQDWRLLSVLTDGKTIPMKEELDGRAHRIQRIPSQMREEKMSFTVPEGHYFMMGDNRDDSNDGRYWGFVPRAYLRGDVLAVGFSLDWNQGWIPRVRMDRFFRGCHTL